MKIRKEGYRALAIAITSLLISGYDYIATLYPFNIRYIRMHRYYNHTWPHMVSLLFVIDIHVNLLDLDAPFSTAISCFWMGNLI